MVSKIPSAPMAPAVAATPAVPPPAVGRREGQAPARGQEVSRGWGRDRSARGHSSPSEPILSDDDAETNDSEETVSRHSESFESGDDDTNSGAESRSDDAASSEAESGDDTGSGSKSNSYSSADGDSAPESSPLRKRTKRASQA